jgi:hypothetical protein
MELRPLELMIPTWVDSTFQRASRHDGADGIRTRDLLRAKEALSQLSYGPSFATGSIFTMGLSGLEPETFPLSEGCSNQLS